MSDYQARKQERRERYQARHGVKMVQCPACSGSGYYDSDGSPKCAGCNGLGKYFPTPLRSVPSIVTPTRRVSQRKHKK